MVIISEFPVRTIWAQLNSPQMTSSFKMLCIKSFISSNFEILRYFPSDEIALSSLSSNFPIPIEKMVALLFSRLAASIVFPGCDERPEFYRVK